MYPFLPPVVAKGSQGTMSLTKSTNSFPICMSAVTAPAPSFRAANSRAPRIAAILRTGVKVLLSDEPTEGLAPVIVQRIGDAGGVENVA